MLSVAENWSHVGAPAMRNQMEQHKEKKERDKRSNIEVHLVSLGPSSLRIYVCILDQMETDYLLVVVN
jgi:hypothetical protein